MNLVFMHRSVPINSLVCFLNSSPLSVQYLTVSFMIIIVYEVDEPPGLFCAFSSLLWVNGVGFEIWVSCRLIPGLYRSMKRIEVNGVSLEKGYGLLPYLNFKVLSSFKFIPSLDLVHTVVAPCCVILAQRCKSARVENEMPVVLLRHAVCLQLIRLTWHSSLARYSNLGCEFSSSNTSSHSSCFLRGNIGSW